MASYAIQADEQYVLVHGRESLIKQALDMLFTHFSPPRLAEHISRDDDIPDFWA